MEQFYQFEATSLQQEKIEFKRFQGNVVLVVNTASKCGFTPQYEGLERLYKKYQREGLVILGFPCNQFGNQEPGDAHSIQTGCLINYGVTFPMFDKIEVNGKNAHPLFIYLKKELPGVLGEAIKWNFTKFIIDKEGTPIKRFAPMTSPESLTSFIENLLKYQS